MEDLETPQEQPEAPPEEPAVPMNEILPEPPAEAQQALSLEDAQMKAVLEAIVYVAEEPLTLAQLAASLQQPAERVRGLLEQLIAEFDRPEHGVTIREVAGGYKMATKPEHHDAVRAFVKSLKPPLKLSLPALETLAVIAYKQPVTSPEIQEIRGVQGAGVMKTLLDRKLIAVAGRKNVIGKPMLYKTTKEFLIQFGLKDLSELPSLKEFEEIRRMALADEPAAALEPSAEPQPTAEPELAADEAAPDSEPVQAMGLHHEAPADGMEAAATAEPATETEAAAGEPPAGAEPEPAAEES
jgi:segregation and condensation protein B